MSTGESRGEQCPICGAVYSHRYSLSQHMKKHEGQTRCSICGQQLSMMHHLRRHMMLKHNMSRQEVDRITNNRLGKHALQDQQRAAAMIGEPSVPPSEGPPYTGDH